MSFAIAAHRIPSISDYKMALHKWETTKPIRGRGYDLRPILPSRKDHMLYVKHDDGSIGLRLYHTDVVVYHPDGSITVEGHSSMSTNAFANTLLPSGLSATFTQSVGYLLHMGDRWGGARTYLFERTITVKRDDNHDWVPITETTPFERKRINVKRANAARKKYRFDEFVTWFRAYSKMARNLPENSPSSLYGYALADALNKAITDLADNNKWPAIVNTFGTKQVVEQLRMAIYKGEDVIDIEKLDHVTADEVRLIQAADKKYNWL